MRRGRNFREHAKYPGPTMWEPWAQRTNAVPLGELGFGVRPVLSDTSTVEELEDEIELIQSTLIDILNEHCKAVVICARSERWWNEDIRDIREKRRTLGRTIKKRRNG